MLKCCLINDSHTNDEFNKLLTTIALTYKINNDFATKVEVFHITPPFKVNISFSTIRRINLLMCLLIVCSARSGIENWSSKIL